MLLIPSLSRGWLLEGGRWTLHLTMLVIAGVVIAHLFRGFILSADGFTDRLLRSVVLPLVGCVVYLSLVVAYWWAQYFLFGGLTNMHDSLSVLINGLLATILGFYVVVPYGMICQIALERVVEEG